MAMASPGLRYAIDRRTRAEYGCTRAPLCADKPRSLSVPAAARRQNFDLGSTAISDGAPSTRARLMLRTRHIRVARSESPAKVRGHFTSIDNCFNSRNINRPVEQAGITLGRIPPKTIPGPGLPRAAEAFDANPSAEVMSEDSLSASRTEASLPGTRPMPVDEKNVGWSGEEAMRPGSEFGVPGKLMELIEDRDRAVHLCLQYRCKLRSTERSLRNAEHGCSALKRQLRETSAAGEATRKLLEQALGKARAEEARALRLMARVRQDDEAAASVVEDAHKARMQLRRARKDLQDLWLERDELAKLAGQAMQGENASRQRIKKLELVIAGLREKLAGMVISEEKMAEKGARADAKAMLAEKGEQELRSAVRAIKYDFEALVNDLRLRDRKIQGLEAANAELAARAVGTAEALDGATAVPPIPSQQGQRASLPEEKPTIAAPREEKGGTEIKGTCGSTGNSFTWGGEKKNDGSCAVDLEAQHTIEERTTNAPKTRQCIGLENKAQGRGHEEKLSAGAANRGKRRNRGPHGMVVTAKPAAVPDVRLAWKQLAPPTATLGRVSAMSYPRCGSRVTLAPPVARDTETRMIRGGGNAAGENAEGAGRAAFGLAHGAREDAPHMERKQSARAAKESPCTAPPPPPPRPSNADEIETLASSFTPHQVRGSPRVGNADPIALASEVKEDSGVGNVGGNNYGHERPDSVETGHRADPVPPTRRPTLSSGSDRIENAERGVVESEEKGDNGTGDADGSTHEHERADSRVTRRKAIPTRTSIESNADLCGIACDREEREASPSMPTKVLDGEKRGKGTDPLALEMNACDQATGVFMSRLVEGVPVLKHGSKGGKPKSKVLWVTSDLSEIFYTGAGRTKNSKQTSRMPLAQIRVARGQGDCPELLHAHTDRCFSLVREDSCGNSSVDDQGRDQSNLSAISDKPALDEDGNKTAERRRWGLGGTLLPSTAHSKRWRGGGVNTFKVSGLGATAPGRLSFSGRGGGDGGGVARERMGLETANVEDCDALVDEINELVRRAGSKRDGEASRGRALFDDWKTPSVLRDGDFVSGLSEVSTEGGGQTTAELVAGVA